MFDLIISSLKTAARTDAYCTKITAPYKALSLAVDPLGTINFPISARTAKALIVEAEPAKFGRRDQTIFDRQVRDAWEIPKSQIKTNGWEEQLESVLHEVQRNLGLPEDGELTAELHNLLIYMPGQFFKKHQDSEKADGMLATLVVWLPSEFTGGELVIEQHGDKQIFQAPHDITEQLTFIAFYSDCHHEVKEVKTGYRIALTYNLFFKASSKTLPFQVNEQLDRELKTYFDTTDEGELCSNGSEHPQWLVYLLDHQYTQKSIGWQELRGADRQRVAEFLSSAKKLGLEAHLALAELHETWSTEGGDYGYRSRSYGIRDRNNEYENKSSDADNYQLNELLEDSIVLCHWMDRAGHHLEGRAHSIPHDMVCWTKAVDEFTPFQTTYEGYMGNYGNTLDRWYHRAAIVLWKKEFHFASLFAGGRGEALKEIRALLQKDIKAGQAAITQILPQWSKTRYDPLDTSMVCDLAALVQDAEVASILVEILGLKSLHEENQMHFLRLIEAYGEQWFLDHLQSWGKRHDLEDLNILTKNLVSLTTCFGPKYSKISSWIMEYRLSEVVASDKAKEKQSSIRDINRTWNERRKVIDALFQATKVAGECDIYRRLMRHILSHPRLYPEIGLLDLLETTELSTKELAQKWGTVDLLDQLKIRFEKVLSNKRDKKDWSIHEKPPHTCLDCTCLQEFLSSSTERTLVWPIAMNRRTHIQEIVDGLDIPVTHDTLREGSPHKLVLTKTPEIFARDLTRTKEAAKGLAKLKKFIV